MNTLYSCLSYYLLAINAVTFIVYGIDKYKAKKAIIRTYFNNDTTWAIVLKETNEPIGCIGYYTHETRNIRIGENDCEVGYWLGKLLLEQRYLHRSIKTNA